MSAEVPAVERIPTVDQPGTALTRTGLLIVAAAVIASAAAIWLMMTAPTRGGFDETRWWIILGRNLFVIGVGLVGWRARPGNRVGPLLIVYGFAGFVSWMTHSGLAVVWSLGDMWYLAGTVVLANIYLAFPEGRTQGWTRALVVVIYAWFILVTLTRQMLREYPASWTWQNPFAVWPNAAWSDVVAQVGSLGAGVLTVLVVVTVVRKWRRGSSAARRALAPVFWVSPLFLAVHVLHFVGTTWDSAALIELSTGPLAQLTGFILPAAFLAGLLRTRLDQASIADLVRDLDGVAPGALEPALAGAVRDPSLRLLFPSPEGSGYVDSSGHSVEQPIDDAASATTRIGPTEQPLAILLHDRAIEPELIAGAAAASHLALENARLAAELRAQLEAVRASRLRIVEAADEERRRLERDLHDGAQQRLVALGFALRDATRRAQDDPQLSAVLEGAQQELEAGLRDLRAIARGLHPSVLDDGLAQAIQELADRSPVPVEVKLERVPLPRSVETTSYFIAAEAMTNALRHAQASSIIVSGAIHDGRYRLTVSDDGRGGVEGTVVGSGMRGLRDRTQALGGTLWVESPPDVGTTVVAELPLR